MGMEETKRAGEVSRIFSTCMNQKKKKKKKKKKSLGNNVRARGERERVDQLGDGGNREQ